MSILSKIFGNKKEDPMEKIRQERKNSSEPWVDVINVNMEDKDDPSTGYLELDWNEAFVKQLVEAGYSGRTEEEIVDQWLNDLCRGIANDTME